jgi:hypothetical protein
MPALLAERLGAGRVRAAEANVRATVAAPQAASSTPSRVEATVPAAPLRLDASKALEAMKALMSTLDAQVCECVSVCLSESNALRPVCTGLGPVCSVPAMNGFPCVRFSHESSPCPAAACTCARVIKSCTPCLPPAVVR